MSNIENEQEKVTALRAELDRCLDRCLEMETLHHESKEFPISDAPNIMVWVPYGYDITPIIRQWANDNDVNLYEVDWSKVDLKFVNDYENGLLKELSVPHTVMLLENYSAINFDTRYLVNSVYKNRTVGWKCKPAPNFFFAIATGSMADPSNYRLDMSEKSCFMNYKF